MNFKQKLGYMCIGCLFTIAGYILATLGGGATNAQQNEQVIDKIVCKHLEVVKEEGKTVAAISATIDGGLMKCFNAAGTEVAAIGADADGNGAIVFSNAAGREVVGIKATVDGGLMKFFNTVGQIVTTIAADENGNGTISVANDGGKEVVSIGATEDGNGVIQTYEDVWRKH